MDAYDTGGDVGSDGPPPDVEDARAPIVLNRRRPRRRRRLRRAVLAAAAFTVSIACVALIGAGLLFARLSQGPLALDLVPQIKAALDERVGHRYAFQLGGTAVEATEHGPALTIRDFALADGGNRPIVTAPRAAIAVDPLALLGGKISPRQLDIRDVELRLLILSDGQVAVAAGAGSAPVPLARAFETQATSAGTELPVGQGIPAAPPRAPATTPGAVVPPTNAALQALVASLRSLVDATTAPDAALASLDTVNVTGRLVLDDRTHDTTTAFNNAELTYQKTADGSAVLQVAADGPSGRWSIAARATRGLDGTKALTVEVDDLSLDEITLAGGLRNVGFDFDMPVSGTASVRIAADDTLEQATGRFKLGKGYFKLDDPDHEPLLIDSISGGFHLDTRTRAVVIDSTELRAGESNFSLTGRFEPPHGADDAWTMRMQASGIFGTERPGEKPIKIARADMTFRLVPHEHRLIIDRVTVDGPDVAFESSGDLVVQGGSVLLHNTSSIRHMPIRNVVRLWPSFIAAPVRAWFLANLRGAGGMLESGRSVVSLTEKDFALMRQQRSVADDHLRIDYAVSDMALNVLNGVPPLSGVSGTGVVTGNTSSFTASRGDMEVAPGRRLALADGTFRAPDTDPKPTPATVDVHVVGGIDVVAELLGREALKPYANLPVDASTVHGQVDARLTLGLMLGDNVPPGDTKVAASVTINNLSADRLIGKEGLSDGTLQLTADKSGFRAKGDGQIYGGPATIEMRRASPNAPSEAVITLMLDAAARAKAGMTFGKQLGGTVAARVSTTMSQGDRKQAAVELDFTRASIDGLLPGFSKPVGKPGKATLTVVQHEGGGASLDNIVFDGGGASLRGTAELDKDGGLSGARLSQVRLSPGDDIKVDVSKAGDTLKLAARGANFDARPFLKWLASSDSGSSDTGDGAKNLDLELHTALLTGQNSQAISGVDLKMTRRGGQLRSLQLNGRLGRQPVTIATAPQGGSPVMVIHAADAGNTLAFMDLYKRMAGGRLDANLTFGPGRLDGYATVHDFALREDPAIKRLATEGLASQARSGGSDAASIDTSSLSFTKLEAKFTKVGNKVSVEDGALFGPQVGATVKGTLDLARDQVNLQGTFVPLFGINNLFSQVPLFGPLLGGGKHEGLFGINYRITGSPSQPMMNINPLSVVAPGFLRQVLGAIDNGAQTGGIEPRDRAPSPAEEAPQPPLEFGQ